MIHLLASSLPSGFPHTTRSVLFQISPSAARPDLVPQLVLRPLQGWSRQTASITSPAPGHKSGSPRSFQWASYYRSHPLIIFVHLWWHLVMFFPSHPRRPLDFANLVSMILYLDTIQTSCACSSFYALFLFYWSSSVYKSDAKPPDSNLESSFGQRGSYFLLWMTMPPTKETNVCSMPARLDVEQLLSQVRALQCGTWDGKGGESVCLASSL